MPRIHALRECVAARIFEGSPSAAGILVEFEPFRRMPSNLVVLGHLLSREELLLLFRAPVGSSKARKPHQRHCLCLTNSSNQTINDHEISCQLLRIPPPGASINIEYASTLIKLAQMMSVVAEKSFDIDRFASSPEALASAAAELDAQHDELGASLRDLVSLDVPLDCVKLPANMTLQQATYIRLMYFVIGMNIHTALTCPWSQLRKNPALLSQVQKSTDIVARTARAAILATHFIRIDASTPVL